MLNGWIILHKKIWESENFKNLRNKGSIILVWIWLLTHADQDGKVTFGRKQIAEDTGINESSVQRALSHIKTKMTAEVNSEVNNTFTTIYILNWEIYQRKVNSKVNNNRTTSEQQVNTNKQIKNKRNKYINTSVLITPSHGNPQLNELLEFAKSLNFVLQGTQKINRFNASNLLKKFGLEKSKKLVSAAVACRGKAYAPAINDFIQLYRKVGDLASYYSKEKGQNGNRIGSL